MKESRRPVVLTVNGKAEIIVQDAAAYQALLEAVERVETLEGIRRGLEQMKRGEGRPAEEVFAEMKRKLSL
jgi:PHD/YefM family antitoxin component YafN of YafNO toxin-antitoxin module